MLQVLRVLLGQRAQQARRVRRDQSALLDPQVQRALRELQVQQDLKVLQDQSERLDRLVSRVPQDQ